MSYQDVTGPLMANSHPGSYCGQDAYTGMFITEKRNGLRNREWSSKPMESTNKGRCIELYARSASNFEGGCYSMSETVRRLTPLECERLQGFPDFWTLIGEPEEVEVDDYDFKYDEDGCVVEKTKTGSHKEIEYFYTDSDGKRRRCADSARYKALGNSIALPWWQWLAKRISAEYEQPVTVGSLFSGIGGFELCFSRAGGIPVWASEIEPFCIEVTKRRFGDG